MGPAGVDFVACGGCGARGVGYFPAAFGFNERFFYKLGGGSDLARKVVLPVILCLLGVCFVLSGYLINYGVPPVFILDGEVEPKDSVPGVGMPAGGFISEEVLVGVSGYFDGMRFGNYVTHDELPEPLYYLGLAYGSSADDVTWVYEKRVLFKQPEFYRERRASVDVADRALFHVVHAYRPYYLPVDVGKYRQGYITGDAFKSRLDSYMSGR